MVSRSSVSQHRFTLHSVSLLGYLGVMVIVGVLMLHIPYRYFASGRVGMGVLSSLVLASAFALFWSWGLRYQVVDYGYGVTAEELDYVWLFGSFVVIVGTAMMPFRLELAFKTSKG